MLCALLRAQRGFRCRWGVGQLLTHYPGPHPSSHATPQKLLNEFSFAYMIADLFFFLLPFTPNSEGATGPHGSLRVLSVCMLP